MKNLSRRTKIFWGTIAGISIVLTGYFFFFVNKQAPVPSQLQISSSTPANNASDVSVFDPISITFNQAVDPENISVTSNPSENWTILSMTPSSIHVAHQTYLRVATKYELTVLQNDKPLETLNFETAHDQNDPRQLQSLQSQLKSNYPLASLTPYETAEFRVVYSAPLTLEITIKGSMSSQDVISQVQSWVEANGVDPSTHKYIIAK